MALRLIEIIIPEQYVNAMLDILNENDIKVFWQTCSCESSVIFKIILPAEKTEKILDILEKKYGHVEGYRMIVLPTEASFPNPQEFDQESNGSLADKEDKAENIPLRVSRHELYNELFDCSRLSKVVLVMVILSTVVAAIGLLRNNIPVVIGAMVIAPLLGPNVALSLATTLGDLELGINALKTGFISLLLALAISFVFGMFVTVDPGIPEIATRTSVGPVDIVLALASGIAGALAFTSGAPTALIGVMVAVALIPPLVVFGLLLGSGELYKSLGALLLLCTNLICINIAGVITFLAQGIRPLNWWEANKAKKATTTAILLWSLLLIVLFLLILLSRNTALVPFLG